MKTPFGMFIVFGPGADQRPTVHTLGSSDTSEYWRVAGLALTDTGVRQAIRQTFGVDGLYALPAWSVECMQQFALTYEGAHQDALRAVCAAAALGRLWGNGGGERVEQAAPKPRKPGPAKVSLYQQLQAGVAS